MPLDGATFLAAFKKMPAHLRQRFMLAKSYRTVADSDAGHVVIADILRFCNAHGEQFVPGEADSTAYNLGKARVARRIQHFLALDEREAIRLATQQQPATLDGDAT